MDKKLLFLVLVFFLVLGAFASQLLYQSTARQIRATNQQPPSAEKSFVLAVSNGKTCTVNSVVRSADETSINGVEVCVTSTLGTVNPVCAPTNESGISQHMVEYDAVGIGQVTAQLKDSFTIPTQVNCEFK